MDQSYSEYADSGRSMLKYVKSYKQKEKKYVIGDQFVSEYELRRAIENTGIVEIERSIETNIFSLEYQPVKNIEILNSYIELEGVYSRKRRTKNYENYTGKIQWICKKCKQINGVNQECMHCKEPNLKWRKEREGLGQ